MSSEDSIILSMEEGESPELESSKAFRVLLIGDANVGKYQFFDSLQELAQDMSVPPGRGWINIPIRSGSYLSFNHIEGLEEDPVLRKWKYKNINIYLIFFSLAKLESLQSTAYKWGPEIRDVMEHLQRREISVHLGLIGLLPDRSNSNLISGPMLDSLKALISPDFYFEMSKVFTLSSISELILLLEAKALDDYSFPEEDDGSSSSGQDESSPILRSSESPIEDSETSMGHCPFLGLDDAELVNELSLRDITPSGENNGIFNRQNIVSRPRQEDLMRKIKGFETARMCAAERSVQKEEYHDLLDQIQKVLEDDNEQIFADRPGKDNRMSKFFIAKHKEGRFSEQSLWCKRNILPQVIPEASWNVSLWNKKKFKRFINEGIPSSDRNQLQEKLKEGFQHLAAADHCHSPSIPLKYLEEFEKIMLECIRVLSTESHLSILKIYDFYLLCQFNLLKCLEYLIYRYPKGFGYFMMSYSRRHYWNPHPLNCIENESFVLKIMKIYHPKLYSAHRDRNGYNFLHYFGDRNFKEAMRLYFQFDLSDSLDPFSHEDEYSSPLAVAAQSGNEVIARAMFVHLTNHFDNDEFLSYFLYKEFKCKSLLRICAQQKLHQLLVQIISAFQNRGLEKNLMELLVEQIPSDGDTTLLQTIQCEKILSQLIEPYLRNDARNLLIKCKKQNHLGHFMAQRNYFNVLQTIHEYCSRNSLSDLFFFEFMFAPNKYGDDCLKLAAWKGSNEFLVSALSMCRGLGQSYLSLLLHSENMNQENLLELLLFQQGSLIVPRQIIMLMEKEFHSSDKVKILSCYREHISPSEGLVSLIEDTNKLLPLSTAKKVAIIGKYCLFFMLSISLYLLDVALDISLAVKYHDIPDTNCFKDFYALNETEVDRESNFERAQRYIGALCYSTRFYITLTFILSPWVFYAFEFVNETFINLRPMRFVHVPYKEVNITSYRSIESAKKQLTAKIEQMEDKRLKWKVERRTKNAGNNLLFVIALIFELFFTIAFWPILSMIKTFQAEISYNIEHGQRKINAREHKVTASKISSRARLIEALLESSFQPILQLYLVLPILMDNIVSDKSRELTQDVILEVIQFGSAISSIAAISWAITTYQADSKGGAMDITVNFFGRAILLLSNLSTISGRLLLFVVFAYGFGPGRLMGLIIFLVIHIVFCTLLVHYWKSPTQKIPSKLMYFLNCIFNGIGNCYLHMWILLPQKSPRKTKSQDSSFARQFAFEALFFVELCSMATFTSFMLDEVVADAIQLDFLIIFIFLLYFFGVALRITYYEFNHLWSPLISLSREIRKIWHRLTKLKTE